MRRSLAQLRAAAAAAARPVHGENRAHLARLWERLPVELRGERQMIGRQAEGCAATVGVQPRCDFACSGCYLGGEANRVPPASPQAIEAQLAQLRAAVGR